MATQNTSEIKEKILNLLRRRGPSLPVHISNEINSSILFSSAFLSELISEKKINMSHMRVGSSPLYYLTGQESLLEKFSNYLKSKEKDAFFLLKEKKFLEDLNQEPAIRIALREIKDFAKPFKISEKIVWRYFIIPEEEYSQKNALKGTEILEKTNPVKLPEEQPVLKTEEIIPEKKTEELEKKPLDIFEKPQEKEEKIQIKRTQKKAPKKKSSGSPKKNEKFFNKVKEFLSEKQIEILDIISFDKSELTLKILEENKEKLLFAFNKKRVSETEILKAYKKSQDYNLEYTLLSLSEPAKKTTNLIEAIKRLSNIENLE